nr:MAG TPA: hypothetical protein [Caudoviricetes sp.]
MRQTAHFFFIIAIMSFINEGENTRHFSGEMNRR